MPKSPEKLQKHLEEEKDKMFRIALHMCGNPDEADDVLQETALKALKNWNKFRGDSQISTWLYRIASNTCLTKKRKLSKVTVDVDQLENLSIHDDSSEMPKVDDWSKDPLTQTLDDELRKTLDQAIMKLPDIYRIVFIMRDIEGLSGEQTAETLDISVSNVKVRLHRARMFLRSELDGYIHIAKEN